MTNKKTSGLNSSRFSILTAILTLAILSSCSTGHQAFMQKRLYRPGFHVNLPYSAPKIAIQDKSYELEIQIHNHNSQAQALHSTLSIELHENKTNDQSETPENHTIREKKGNTLPAISHSENHSTTRKKPLAEPTQEPIPIELGPPPYGVPDDTRGYFDSYALFGFALVVLGGFVFLFSVPAGNFFLAALSPLILFLGIMGLYRTLTMLYLRGWYFALAAIIVAAYFIYYAIWFLSTH